MTTPPFTLTGWMLGRAADRAELIYVYLNKLKHAKSMEDRMLVHAELVKMQMEKYGSVAKEVNVVMEMTSTLFGSVIQMFRHKQNYDAMAQRNSELAKPTTKSLEERLAAIEQLLTNERTKKLK